MKYFNREIVFNIDLDSFLIGFALGIYSVFQFIGFSQIVILILGAFIGVLSHYYYNQYYAENVKYESPKNNIETSQSIEGEIYNDADVQNMSQSTEEIRHVHEPIVEIDEEPLQSIRYPNVPLYKAYLNEFTKNKDYRWNIKISEMLIAEEKVQKTTLRHIIKRLVSYIKSNELGNILNDNGWETIICGRSHLKTAKYIEELDICIRNNENAYKYILDIFNLAIIGRIPIRARIHYIEGGDQFIIPV